MNPGGRRLKQWLIEQINSNIYSGLLWEDEAHTMFRIPWKHAGKQDYNQEVDASIFKAWAVFKGKFKEGDKAEPATWKTRLRCALNKSPDFEEVTDRSQLDISEPYKVYRIVPEEEQKLGKNVSPTLNMSCPNDGVDMVCNTPDLDQLIKEASDEYTGIIKRSHSPMDENCNVQSPQEFWHQGSPNVLPVHPDTSPINSFNSAFAQMMISFYYGGKLMGHTLISHSDGCRISPCQPPVSNALLYGSDSLQTVRFPPVDLIDNERQRYVTCKLFGHLERGVLLRANREGIFIKRLCQSRVFWSGQDSQYSSGVSKLERDAVVKIFDNNRFLQALQMYQDNQYPAPDPTVSLCFGEEFADFSTAKNKLIIVQITAAKCQQLLDAVTAHRAQYSSNLEISDELSSDQMARIYQDICNYSVPPRPPCYRDNLPIIA
ncbi:interferon regulatory factor 8 isoform X1 [Pangasianodon hypophthalmus]|uniref:interferon regulatory factor 8 isoform X1 n=1 Tax=Pangasianodon hypophthalmus TaxID=310915 RepID=UPI000EFF5D9A|nr:interferon regulatory factor 8 isoform X1 [Pangasianodon hypophthalmus]XP_053090706.1 interferon regulatory factor 8 isoform X1 [Pangasianodon hypophthalmus]